MTEYITKEQTYNIIANNYDEEENSIYHIRL